MKVGIKMTKDMVKALLADEVKNVGKFKKCKFEKRYFCCL